MIGVLRPMRLWCVQTWCFPYRSYDAGGWSPDWPWWAFNPRHADEGARATKIIEEWDARKQVSPSS